MSFDAFCASLEDSAPPSGLSAALLGLWHARRGDWTRAHEIVQDDPSREAAWVHAYLHREEGDSWNAGYWYRQAGRPVCSGPLDEEWRAMVAALLG